MLEIIKNKPSPIYSQLKQSKSVNFTSFCHSNTLEDRFISFNGIKKSNNESKPDHQKELKNLEALLFSKEINKNPKVLVETLYKTCLTLAEFSYDNKIPNIDAEAYFNRLTEIFEKAKKYPDFEEKLLEFSKDIIYICCAYNYFDKPIIDKVDRFFSDQLKNLPSSEKLEQINHFYNLYTVNNDKDWQEITDIREKIYRTRSKKLPAYNKLVNALLNQELLIHCQEILEPEKYLDRAIKMGVKDLASFKPDEALKELRISSMSNLRILLSLMKDKNITIESLSPNNFAGALRDIISNEKDSSYKKYLIQETFYILSVLYDDLNADNKKFTISLAKKMYDLKFLKTKLNKSDPILKEVESKLFEKFNDKNTKPSIKANIFRYLARYSSINLEDKCFEMLSKSEKNEELFLSAVWTAGYYPSDRNIGLLIDIIKPDEPFKIDKSTQEKFRLKEIAINALAYSEDKKAKEVLNKIYNSRSDFKDLAEALIERLDKKYLKDQNYIAKKLIANDKERTEYIRLRNNYFKEISKQITNEDICWADKVMIPFRKVLKDMVAKKSKLYINHDTIAQSGLVGSRTPNGFFYETAGGSASDICTGINLSDKFDNPSNGGFVFGHEFGHVVHSYLKTQFQQDNKRFNKLLQQAIESNNLLDSYAVTNKEEYFAQCFEAFSSVYKSQDAIIFNDNFDVSSSNTRYTLIRKNPELYEFFEKLFEKFNRINLNTELKLTA